LTEEEEWIELAEFPGYAVSTFGRVINTRTEFIRTPSYNQQGIAKVSLYQGPRLVTRSLANLVLDAFEPDNPQGFNSLIHLDGSKRNCSIFNLMRRPRWFALRYHDQFSIEEFTDYKIAVQEIGQPRVYDTFVEVCASFGILYMDVIQSCYEKTEVWPVGKHFRFC